MSQFIKFVLASVIGIIIGLGLLFFIVVGIMGALSDTKPSINEKSVLKLDFSNSIPELTNNVATSPFDFEQVNTVGLHKTIALIENAATDDKIKGILIKNNSTGGGFATMSSIRKALLTFKESDKFVYAYSDYYSQGAYYLASVADSIFLNPQGMADVKGFAVLSPYFKEALDEIGVKMNVFYAGDFKSATEPFRRNEMSEENRLQTTEFLESMATNYISDVAASRNMTYEKLDQVMAEYAGGNAKGCLESGLVDKLAYFDELEDVIKSNIGIEADDKIEYVSIDKYNQVAYISKNGKAKDKIAIIYAEGEIQYNSKEKGLISEKKYASILKEIENADDIKAVVLRVNSPGGNSLSSDIIWHGIEEIKASGKPVVASFGDYAASGGYYISAGADTIVSEKNTLTGSIGVFMMIPDASTLVDDKLGINFDEVKTHPMAVPITPFKPLDEREKQYLQQTTNDIYDTFISRVAEGRNMDRASVEKIAQGRVWTGEKAQELGLVDVIGDLDKAIEIAAEMADSEDYKLSIYPEIEETFLDQFVKGLKSTDQISSSIGIDKKELAYIKEYRKLKSFISDLSPQARLPFEVSFD